MLADLIKIDHDVAEAEGWFTEDEMNAIHEMNTLSCHSYTSSD